MTAFAGTYHELRAVKTRGTWQVVVELPRHEAEKLIAAWGLPDNATERWVALALLSNEQAKSVGRSSEEADSGRDATPRPATPPKREAPQRCPTAAPDRLLQYVSIACGDPNFQAWLGLYANIPHALDHQTTAECVRQLLGVKSRAEISTNPVAREKAKDLMFEYDRAMGRATEDRS